MEYLAYFIGISACIGLIVLIMRIREWHFKRWLSSNGYTLLSKTHEMLGVPGAPLIMFNRGAITYSVEVLDHDGQRKTGWVYINGIFGVSKSHIE